LWFISILFRLNINPLLCYLCRMCDCPTAHLSLCFVYTSEQKIIFTPYCSNIKLSTTKDLQKTSRSEPFKNKKSNSPVKICVKTNRFNNYSFSLLIMSGRSYLFRSHVDIFMERSCCLLIDAHLRSSR
jgi:hypothetical protein